MNRVWTQGAAIYMIALAGPGWADLPLMIEDLLMPLLRCLGNNNFVAVNVTVPLG